MATTWKLLETWDGTREQTYPDPENEGETKTETLTGITDIKVLFTCKDKTPNVKHERTVNVVLDADGKYDEAAMKECWGENTNDILNSFQEELSQLDDWNSSNIDESINIFVNAINVGKGKLMQPLRIALTGALKGPSIPDLMTLLGKETCLIRFKNILKNS